MHTAHVQFEITPTACGEVVAGVIRTVEAEKNCCILHHLLRLKVNPELRVFVGYIIGRVGLEEGFVGDGKDNR